MVKDKTDVSSKLQQESKKIITLWKAKLQDVIPKSALSKRQQTLNVFLQLVLLRFEYDYFEEHKINLAKETRNRLLFGNTIESILSEMEALLLALKEVAESCLSPKEYKSFIDVLCPEYSSWLHIIAEEYARCIEESHSKIISEMKRWDQNAFDLAPIPMLVADSKGIIKRVNVIWSEQTGKPAKIFLNGRIKNLLGKDLQKLLDLCLAGSGSAQRASHTSVSSKVNLPLVRRYEWRPILENKKPIGAILFAMPSGLCLYDSNEGSLITDLLSGKQSFGPLMASIRKKRGLMMTEVANKIDCARGYLSHIENKRHIPSFDVIKAIADFLDPDGSEGLLVAGVLERIPENIRNQLPWI